MSLITKPKTFTPKSVAASADVNSNFDTLYNDYNGNITNANLATSANIADTKLASITTAGKVDGSALTNLDNIPIGAGTIPAELLPSTVPSVTALGSISGTNALSENIVYTATLTNNTTFTLPTPSSGAMHTIVVEFTMASLYTVTMTGVTWNFGATPTYATGTTKNRITLDTIDGGTTWKGYYSQF